MYKADKFIIVDHVQYERHDWQNRNRIRTKEGEVFLTIPIKRTGQNTPLHQVMIDNSTNWRRKHWMTLEQAYKKSPFWDCYSGFFKELYEQEWNYLADINFKIIGYLATCFNIQTLIAGRTSNFSFREKKTDLLIEMTKFFRCNGYLNGKGAKEYVDEKKFKDAGLECRWLDFKHPEYKQMWEPFMPNMSAIDILFNYGSEAKNILFKNGTQKKEM
ncbi:WbqC family protein [Candidatus Woesearchaeota archaeon]|nr:WbqC family protein [Candidatus Woesearchaeota archaeon]